MMMKMGEYNAYLEAIEEYSKFRCEDIKPTVIINKGLNVFVQAPYVEFASLFVMDMETFEFNQTETIPSNQYDTAHLAYQFLLNTGIIGMALSQKSISFVDIHDVRVENEFGNSVVIPLIKTEGVIGLVILKLSRHSAMLSEKFFIYSNIHSSMFAYSLENNALLVKSKNEEGLLDQKVAIRTLNLIQSKKQLADKIGNLQESLAMSVPHEFRTPINQIVGNTDFLITHMEAMDKDESREVLTDIKQSVDRLKHLIENYLFYANLTVVASDLEKIHELQNQVTIGADSFISDTVQTKVMLYDRQSDLVINLEPADLQISPYNLIKLIQEITDNALKYSHKNSRVVVDGMVNGNFYSIMITDSGRGMTSEQIENIGAYVQFERRNYEQQGLGLGLAIAIRIAQLHNGEFYVDSKQGEFTNVTFKLPLLREKVPD